MLVIFGIFYMVFIGYHFNAAVERGFSSPCVLCRQWRAKAAPYHIQHAPS
ncbi:MAG: hypothetical protein RQ733_04405 [Methyloprofundus sp.]|nr:hypothetical protein [Methyloprofundus sp.]